MVINVFKQNWEAINYILIILVFDLNNEDTQMIETNITNILLFYYKCNYYSGFELVLYYYGKYLAFKKLYKDSHLLYFNSLQWSLCKNNENQIFDTIDLIGKNFYFLQNMDLANYYHNIFIQGDLNKVKKHMNLEIFKKFANLKPKITPIEILLEMDFINKSYKSKFIVI